jgi:hypothetical protein
LPEINTLRKTQHERALRFSGRRARENSIPKQAEIGLSMEFYWRPLKNLRPNGVDEAKTRFILLSFGSRYLPSSETPATHRILLMATRRLPSKSKLVISDRTSGELNFSRGELNWRYRNR